MEQQNPQANAPEPQTNPDAGTTPSPTATALQRQNAAWVVEVVQSLGETTIIVPREHIATVCGFLKATPGLEFNFLSDVCGFDRGPEAEPRFEVNYHLFSTTKHHRVRLKVVVDENDAHVPSVTGVWRTANWHERETYDLVGVKFTGHPDLRRILLPSDFDGHALRKDYPLRGYEPYSLN